MLFVKTPGSVKFSFFHILICTNKIKICIKNWRLHTKINATIYYSIILMLLVIIKNLGNSWSISLFLFYFLCSCNSFLYLLLDPVLVTSSHIWESLHIGGVQSKSTFTILLVQHVPFNYVHLCSLRTTNAVTCRQQRDPHITHLKVGFCKFDKDWKGKVHEDKIEKDRRI